VPARPIRRRGLKVRREIPIHQQLAAHDGLAHFGVAGDFAHVDQTDRVVGFDDDETVERVLPLVRDAWPKPGRELWLTVIRTGCRCPTRTLIVA
jgi:hypothetical protein